MNENLPQIVDDANSTRYRPLGERNQVKSASKGDILRRSNAIAPMPSKFDKIEVKKKN